MKILIACEYSGIVRDAFLAAGHNAISCDLLPTESPGPHYQGDVLDIINDSYDIMIAHPPCTYLSYAAMRVWNAPGRCEKRLNALDFFRRLWEAPIKYICIENPRSCASPVIAKYSQEIQPYYFGDRQLKTIWLWLKNLPLLKHYKDDSLFQNKTHTNKPRPSYVDPSGDKHYFVSDCKNNRAKNRSKFWPGIADAMCSQWGDLK